MNSVFRAYDIRGFSPQEIDEEFACRLARALIREFQPKHVLVGRDMRLTSPVLEAALIQTLVKYGVRVTRIGYCTTPLFNVTIGLAAGKYSLGVMITASHNPAAYNGFKLIRGDASPIGQGCGMEEIASSFQMDAPLSQSIERGTIEDDVEAVQRYIRHILNVAALPESMPHIKIAIDAGNGMAGVVIPELMKQAPWLEIIPLYFELDGSFPHHEADPVKSHTLKELAAAVKNEHCLFGVAFDGDADRIGFVDEEGEPIRGDLMLACIAEEVLKTYPAATVLYDLRSSWAVPEAIRAIRGTAEMCRVGHAYIKQTMRETGAVFAGELSMHYYFRDLFCVESGDLVLLYILRRLAREGVQMSTVWRRFRSYVHSGEINFRVQDAAHIFERIRLRYEPYASSVSTVDGLRLEFIQRDAGGEDWWFSLRSSNTEPVLRLNLEAREKTVEEKRLQEIEQLIESLGGVRK